MKRKLIEATQSCLVTCDNPLCDFTIPYTPEDDKNTYKYIDIPCPNCGENLLTKEDYLMHEKVLKAVNWFNKWFSWITIFYSKKSWDKRGTTTVHVHDGIKISPNK